MKISVVGHDQISPRQYLLWKKVNDLGLAEVQVLAPERWHAEHADSEYVTPVDTLYVGDINRYMMNVEPHILKFKPDWIVSMTEFWRQQSFINLQIGKVYGIKTAFYRWENLPLDNQLPEGMQAIERDVLSGADLLICGNREAEEITRPQTKKRIVRLLETGIDTDTFKPYVYTLPTPYVFPKKILYVGRQVHEKGIEVIREATKNISGCELIVNDGLTPYNQLPELMNNASVGVIGSVDLPNWKEQCCFVIGEMLACGLPVVSTDAGSIPEIWGQCPLLRLVPQNNPGAMREAIVDVIKNPPDRKRGPEWVQAVYSNTRLAQKYVEALS